MLANVLYNQIHGILSGWKKTNYLGCFSYKIKITCQQNEAQVTHPILLKTSAIILGASPEVYKYCVCSFICFLLLFVFSVFFVLFLLLLLCPKIYFVYIAFLPVLSHLETLFFFEIFLERNYKPHAQGKFPKIHFCLPFS